ncbi:MAG: ABC transporter permease [Oscillospiraceae bacterium]|jgi:ABC-2 type transport system permease protein|nr:ABC transporter permease [Oscillospiraceae bacterium]
MADKITFTRVIKLLGISAKMDLAWFLRDTKYALAIIGADIVSNLSVVSAVFLISARFGGIGGMSVDEVLFMMAYSTLITGIFVMFGSHNNIHISRIIGRGQLEHLFIQPLPINVQLATCSFSPFTGGSNFFVGVVLMIIAERRLGLQVSFGWVLSLAVYLFITMVVIVARSYLVSSLAFYAPVAMEEISYTAVEGTWLLSTFPLSGMPPFVQIPLLTVLPEGLMAWFPSLCLLGRPPLGLSVYYPALYVIILLPITSYIFKRGLSYYVRKGSNRYVPYGFRR